MPLGANLLPWLRGSELARLDRMLEYFLLLNQVRRLSSQSSILRRLTRLLVSEPIRWRINSSLFSFPWELWLSRLTEHLIKRRSLVTGRELPSVESANAC